MAPILTTSKRRSSKLGDVFVIGIDRRRASDRKGRYAIAVKVIDIFGNDTTKAIKVTV